MERQRHRVDLGHKRRLDRLSGLVQLSPPIVAEDTTGLTSSPSSQATATVAADTTLPKAVVTAPAAGASVSGASFSASATASDPGADHTLSYGFDATGFRRSRSLDGTSSRYLLGGLIETTAAGTITGFDIDGPAGDLAHYTSAPSSAVNPSYAYYSGHGDLAAQADHTGTRTSLYRYDPYGNPTTTPAGTTTQELYTGRWDKKHDPTSNLIEMGARPYSPDLGRFLTTDPIDGGSANQYDYAAQDPINAHDLDGTRVVDEGTPCHLTCNAAPTGGFAGSAATDRIADYVRRYGSSCVVGGATNALVSGAAGFVGGCAFGVGLEYWSRMPGRAGRLGEATSKVVDIWTVRGALHKAFGVPRLVDLLRANGVRVRLHVLG